MTVPERTRVLLAALDSTPIAHSVLAVARSVAEIMDADVESLHASDGAHTARMAEGTSREAGVALRRVKGPPAEAILRALNDPVVVGAVMGIRAFHAGSRPAGSVARHVISKATKPIVFVPPEAHHPGVEAPRRFLVPLDASKHATTAFLELERILRSDPEREITVLLTFDGTMPAMLDRPVRDLPEWGRGFLQQHCPGEHRSFVWRTGNPGSAVIDVAESTQSDLIVLSFRGSIEVGHGAVVREVLARSVVPVLILPVPPIATGGAARRGRVQNRTKRPGGVTVSA